MSERAPSNPAEWRQWVSSLSPSELENVCRASNVARELRALAQAGKDLLRPVIDPAPPSIVDSAPQTSPRRGTVHEFYGWREVKKWILVGIARRGGSASVAEVIDFVLANIKDELIAEDLEYTDETTEPRWRNRVRWERENLAEQGDLDRGPRGIWALTDKGRRLMGLS